jgi:hypothetical protein
MQSCLPNDNKANTEQRRLEKLSVFTDHPKQVEDQ